MTKSKNTKRTLLASVCSMILCVAMLIGSTFAWFTDNASTAVNKIQSGTLDVALVDAEGNSLEGKTLEWIKADGAAENEEVLWEPGCTYKLQPVYVKNNGNLALKFKIVISGINGDAKLLEAIDFTYGELDVNAEGYLQKNQTSEAITIEGHMKKDAGNKYQNLSIDGIGITVIATQNTVENDSYNNQYDKNAEYPIVNAADLKTAIESGGKAVLSNNIEIGGEYTGSAPFLIDTDNASIDLNGHTITISNNVAFKIVGENVTIKNGTIRRASGRDYSYGLKLNGVNTTVENIVIDSGINVSGYNPDDSVKPSVSANIVNCHISLNCDWAYYGVCAQGEATVTVSGGDITRNVAGKANNYFWIEKEFTDALGHVGDSSMIIKNVIMNSTCNTTLYNTGGLAPNIIGD